MSIVETVIGDFKDFQPASYGVYIYCMYVNGLTHQSSVYLSGSSWRAVKWVFQF